MQRLTPCRPAGYALLFACLSCGGLTEREEDFAKFTELRQDGTAEVFHFEGSEVQCRRYEGYPHVLGAHFVREGNKSVQLLIRLAPFGQAQNFFASNETSISEEGPLHCSDPCSRFNWQNGIHHAASNQQALSCLVRAQFDSRAVRGSFECVNMQGPQGATSIVDGTFGCTL